MRHATHICWSCGGHITPDQDEDPVIGLAKPEIRYRHADDGDCRESINATRTRHTGHPADPLSFLDDQREDEGGYYQ